MSFRKSRRKTGKENRHQADNRPQLHCLNLLPAQSLVNLKPRSVDFDRPRNYAA